MIVLKDYRQYPQTYGAMVVAFHLEVFRVLLFIFSQRRARYTYSNKDINMITYLHSGS
jgi:TRAP-type C4-dicarboxylate transport system permease small subunit